MLNCVSPVSIQQNISAKTLGRLVLDAVERSVDPLSNEIQVFKFLNNLYISARDYERMSTESQIHFALREVEAHSKTLAKIEEQTIMSKQMRETKRITTTIESHQQTRSHIPGHGGKHKQKIPRKDNQEKETFL